MALASLEGAQFIDYTRLFRPEEGRMGATVTFMAILELVREGLLDLVQAEIYGPLHVRAAGPGRGIRRLREDSGDEMLEEPVEGVAFPPLDDDTDEDEPIDDDFMDAPADDAGTAEKAS